VRGVDQNKSISTRKISLNSILMILVLAVLIFFFFADSSGTYLIGAQAQVYLLLAVTFFALAVNFRFKSEFLEILNVVFVIFYIFRIPFIFIPDVASDVIQKGVDITQINWYITVLAYQYLSLVICILIVNPRIPRWHLDNRISEFIFSRMLIFLFIVIVANVYLALFWFDIHKQVLSNIPSILKTIFTIKNALFVIIVSSLIVEKKLFSKYKYPIVFTFLLGIGATTYVGGKSGLLEIILLVYLGMVVLYGPVVFKLRGLIITVISFFVAFMMYPIGSISRGVQLSTKVHGYDNFIHHVYIELISLHLNSTIIGWINAISYRIGYFDFYLEIVSNPIYEQYVKFTYYFKAVVDKLSPGFDIFNVGFMSRKLYSSYYGDVGTIMNSNLVTVFGESHLLLGFFSFCLFFPLLLFFKYALSCLRTSSRLADALLYAFLAYLFYWWLTGMGLDMWVTFLVYDGIFIFSIIILIWFLGRREMRNTLDSLV
jgi:hypothetical protein